jgi:hypothetical protein
MKTWIQAALHVQRASSPLNVQRVKNAILGPHQYPFQRQCTAVLSEKIFSPTQIRPLEAVCVIAQRTQD